MQIKLLMKKWLSQVVEIEEKSGSKWKEKDFLNFFKDNGMGFVLEDNNKIIGFICLIIKNDTLHVPRICIAQKYKRKKYGTQLYDFITKNNKDPYKHMFSTNKKYFYAHEKDNESLKFFVSKGLRSKLGKKLFKNGDDAIVFFDFDENF
jgi:hypothetical protein